MSAATDVCKSRLEQFLRRELADWEGLPDGCAERDVGRWLPLRAGEGIAHLGSEMVEYRFRAAEVAGFPEPVRLHIRAGVLCLVRTGLWSTDHTECTRLLRALGDRHLACGHFRLASIQPINRRHPGNPRQNHRVRRNVQIKIHKTVQRNRHKTTRTSH